MNGITEKIDLCGKIISKIDSAVTEKFVDVLGTRYKITSETEEENKKLEGSNGFLEPYTKTIVIENVKQDKMTVDNLESFKKKVLRHEIIHAFLFESGLDACCEYGRNEELVDWIALQLPKILIACSQADCL